MCSKELRKSFTPSYFSLSDILAAQTRIPCRTLIAITKFGFLDHSQASPDLQEGSLIELPLWAARVMTTQKRAFVTLKMPKSFNDGYREVLKADPAVVDLNKMGPHFYQSGLQLCTLPSDEAGNVSEILPDVLQKRLAAMSDSYSLTRESKSTDDVTANQAGRMLQPHYMDPLEVDIFNDAKDSAAILDKWLKS